MKIGNDIQHAAQLLQAGTAVAIPTETVYGLAANAFDPEAVIRIFEIKQRPKFNPLIVHISNWEMLDKVATEMHPQLKNLATVFWPGPLTILLHKKPIIHDIVTAGSEMVAVRMPNHAVTLQLLNALDFPLAAPSANLFGSISPTTAKHVEAQLGNQLAYILDGGDCAIGVESTIIKLDENEKIVILRPGGISQEAIAQIVGYVPAIASSTDNPEAPGMLKSHYAPKIPLVIGNITALLNQREELSISILSFNKTYNHPKIIKAIDLSPSGDLHEAARNLFTAMHELEDSGAAIILTELLPNKGIGMAINDRLSRAAS